QAIAAICQAEEWALGEVWLYDAAASVLRLDGTWHAPGLRDVHGIELASTGLAIRPGVGLVGRVWQRDTPVWIRDLREEEELGWAEYADRLGLRSAVGFPIRARSGVEAVAVLFSQAIREPDVQVRTKAGQLRRALMSIEYLDLRDQPTIITTLVDITEFVGAREAQARLAAIVQSSEDAIFAKSLTGEILTWNTGAERMY